MRRFTVLVPWIAFGLCAIAGFSSNLTCRFFFPEFGTTTALKFSFGWPFSYLEGNVPGLGIRRGVGPNKIWGYPEMNKDKQGIKTLYRDDLSGLPKSPWGMSQYGEFRAIPLVGNFILIVLVWPLFWLVVRHANAEREHDERFKPFSDGARVRFNEGPFKEYVGNIEEIDMVNGQITIRLDVQHQQLRIQVTPEEIKMV